jgi:hypothetical protein
MTYLNFPFAFLYNEFRELKTSASLKWVITLKINDGGVCGRVDSATIVYWLLPAVYFF